MKFKYIKLNKVESTNECAKQIAEKETEEGMVVTAKEQTGGKGRFGRNWFSPNGGIYCSIILRPKIPVESLHSLTFISAIAVSDSIKEQFKKNTIIKWPNDIIIKRKKICGILTESKSKGKKVLYAVVGIGVNINIDKFPEELKYTAYSLKGNKEDLLKTIIEKFGILYKEINK